MNTATFEVSLSEHRRIRATATIGGDDELLAADSYVYDGTVVVSGMTVDPDSGLWQAMIAWLDEMRRASESNER